MRDKKFFSSKDEMDALTAQLKVMGVAKVNIRFAGGGDSGQVEYVGFLDEGEHEVDVNDGIIAWTEQTYGSQVPQQKPMPLNQAMEDIAYRVLDETGMDWYNNDGGQGYVVVEVGETLKIKVDMEINITTSEEHEFEYHPVDDAASYYPTEQTKGE